MNEREIVRDDYGAPMRVSATRWEGRGRIDVTASLPAADQDACDRLRESLEFGPGRDGATLSGPHLGIWQGERETAYTLTRIGADDSWVRWAVAAAIRAGCSAVQVERFGERAGNCGYACEEWRAA